MLVDQDRGLMSVWCGKCGGQDRKAGKNKNKKPKLGKRNPERVNGIR